jgi:hypothetical protein
LTLELTRRRLLRGARRLDLRRGGTSLLLGSPGIESHQHLTGLDAAARSGVERDDRAGHLRRQHRLPYGFDDAVEACCLARGYHGHRGSREVGALVVARRRQGHSHGERHRDRCDPPWLDAHRLLLDFVRPFVYYLRNQLNSQVTISLCSQ